MSVTFAGPQYFAELGLAALTRADGTAIPDALLDRALWSPDRTTATFLLDPGRVKTGLIAHDKAGWALSAGQPVILEVGGRAVHRWMVVAGGCVVPDIGAWVIESPKARTTHALSLHFPGAIDALSRDLIAVADESGGRISGNARLIDSERIWVFTPSSPWPPGRLQIVVHPRLESPCGDEAGEPFEHHAGAGIGSRRAALHRTFIVN